MLKHICEANKLIGSCERGTLRLLNPVITTLAKLNNVQFIA